MPGFQAAFLQAKTHGAAQVGICAAAFDFAAGGAPFGDQRDGRIFAVTVDFGGIGTRQPAAMAQHIDHRRLHAVANAEIRDIVLAGELRGLHFAFEAAVAESARHQDAIDIGEQSGAFGFNLLGFQPFQTHAGALAQAAVAQGFADGFVGILMVDVFADHRDGDFIDGMLDGIDHSLPIAANRPGRPRSQDAGG